MALVDTADTGQGGLMPQEPTVMDWGGETLGTLEEGVVIVVRTTTITPEGRWP